jgi:hypothetical protein
LFDQMELLVNIHTVRRGFCYVLDTQFYTRVFILRYSLLQVLIPTNSSFCLQLYHSSVKGLIMNCPTERTSNWSAMGLLFVSTNKEARGIIDHNNSAIQAKKNCHLAIIKLVNCHDYSTFSYPKVFKKALHQYPKSSHCIV